MTESVRWAWERRVQLCDEATAAEKHVALNLATYFDKLGRAEPGIDRQARDTGLHPRTVQKALRAWEERGYLDAEVGGGRSNTTLYTAKTPAHGHRLEAAAEAETVALSTETVALSTGNPGPRPPEQKNQQTKEQTTRVSTSDSFGVSGTNAAPSPSRQRGEQIIDECWKCGRRMVVSPPTWSCAECEEVIEGEVVQ